MLCKYSTNDSGNFTRHKKTHATVKPNGIRNYGRGTNYVYRCCHWQYNLKNYRKLRAHLYIYHSHWASDRLDKYGAQFWDWKSSWSLQNCYSKKIENTCLISECKGRQKGWIREYHTRQLRNPKNYWYAYLGLSRCKPSLIWCMQEKWQESIRRCIWDRWRGCLWW